MILKLVCAARQTPSEKCVTIPVDRLRQTLQHLNRGPTHQRPADDRLMDSVQRNHECGLAGSATARQERRDGSQKIVRARTLGGEGIMRSTRRPEEQR